MYFIRGCCRYQYRRGNPPRPLPSLQSTLISPSTFSTLLFLVSFFPSPFLPLFALRCFTRLLFLPPNGLFNLNKFEKSGQPPANIRFPSQVASLSYHSFLVTFVSRNTDRGLTPGCLRHRRVVPFFAVCFLLRREFPVFQAYSFRSLRIPEAAELYLSFPLVLVENNSTDNEFISSTRLRPRWKSRDRETERQPRHPAKIMPKFVAFCRRRVNTRFEMSQLPTTFLCWGRGMDIGGIREYEILRNESVRTRFLPF